jgi:hypothetical protein
VELSLLDATTGVSLGKTSLDLPPLGFAQVSDVFGSLGVTRDVSVAAATFTASRDVFTFGIVLENATSLGRVILP